jgi:hypothetical protein
LVVCDESFPANVVVLQAFSAHGTLMELILSETCSVPVK